jgi:excinuclease ABC subunit A
VMLAADHLVDLGPEGGAGGGTIIATGSPEEVAKVKGSHTARVLREMLGNIPAKKGHREEGRTGDFSI